MHIIGKTKGVEDSSKVYGKWMNFGATREKRWRRRNAVEVRVLYSGR